MKYFHLFINAPLIILPHLNPDSQVDHQDTAYSANSHYRMFALLRNFFSQFLADFDV
jgi:hypothetical protein